MPRVTVLGSGDAFGAGGRLHSAYLVQASGVTFTLDCGPSILQALRRVKCDPGRLDFVVLSHLHGDHFGGVPFLFMDYRYESRRTRSFGVHGPHGTQARVERLFSALYEHPAQQPYPHPVEWSELSAGTPLERAGARITPLPVPHVPELQSFAYLVEVEGRRILYSGDSAWTDDFFKYARDVDLFLCECSTYETKLDIHISYPEIAARAQKLGCRRLVLTHLGSEPLARLADIKLECARDGLVLDL